MTNVTDQDVRRLHNEVSRGDQAKLVLDNAIYQEAMIKIEAELIAKLRDSEWSETEQREELYRRLQTVKWFESYVEKVMKSGMVANEKLTTFAKLRQNAKKLVGL